LHGPAKPGAQFLDGDSRGEADRQDGFSYDAGACHFIQQIRDRKRADGNDQDVGLRDCRFQVGGGFDAILAAKRSQLSRIMIVHHDATVVSCQAQSRNQRAGDAASPEKDRGFGLRAPRLRL
jgi:hypothetical protein